MKASTKHSTREVLRKASRHGSLYLVILAQSAIFNVLFYVDSYFMGFVGDSSLSALSAATQVTWLYEALITCVAAAMGLIINRHYGQGLKSSIRVDFSVGLYVSIVAALALLVAAELLQDVVTEFMVADSGVGEEMGSYLQIALPGHTVGAIAMVYEVVLQSTGRGKIVLYSYALELVAKIFFNAFFVFVLGSGVTGVAISLLIAKVMRLGFFMAYYRDGYTRPSKLVLGDVRAIGREALPLGTSVLLWNASTVVVSSGFGHLDVASFTAYSLLGNALYLLLIPVEAFTKTAAILVGRLLGRSALDDSDTRVRIRQCLLTGQVITVASVVAACGYMLATPVIHPALSEDAYSRVTSISMIFGLYVLTKCLTDMVSEGVLRAGLDNRFLAMVELICLPFTWMIFHYLNYDLVYGYSYVLLLEAVRAAAVFWRVHGSSWAKGVGSK